RGDAPNPLVRSNASLGEGEPRQRLLQVRHRLADQGERSEGLRGVRLEIQTRLAGQVEDRGQPDGALEMAVELDLRERPEVDRPSGHPPSGSNRGGRPPRNAATDSR